MMFPLADLTISDLIDVTLVAFVLYSLFFWFKRTRAAFVLIGVLILSGIYIAVRVLKLHLAESLLQGFFAVILVAGVVIFQEELRRLFEQIAFWSLNPKLRRDRRATHWSRLTEVLTRTLFDLASDRIGAIVVLSGKNPLVRHLDGGIQLEGIASEPLLKSLFDPHSPGHDGAVVLRGDRVEQFSCQLPLSRDFGKMTKTGTRHAAALGLSEVTDALCLVVSEERGTVSAARNGSIRVTESPSDLASLLESFRTEMAPPVVRAPILSGFLRGNLWEKVAAVLVSLVLWFVFVHESVVVYRSYDVPLRHVGLDPSLRITQVQPDTVSVVVSGKRRDYYFVSSGDLKATLKLFDLDEILRPSQTRYEWPLSPSNVTLPSDLSIVSIHPRSVVLRIEPADGKAASQAP